MLRRHDIAAALFVRHENIRYTVAVKGHAFCPQLSYALVFAEHEPILYELGDRIERHFGEEQDFSALLHDRVVLFHHFDVERGDGLRQPAAGCPDPV